MPATGSTVYLVYKYVALLATLLSVPGIPLHDIVLLFECAVH